MLFLAESWVLIGRWFVSETESWAFDGLCPFRPAQDDTTVQYGINDKSLAEHSSLSFAPAHPPKLRSSFNDTHNTIVVSGLWFVQFFSPCCASQVLLDEIRHHGLQQPSKLRKATWRQSLGGCKMELMESTCWQNLAPCRVKLAGKTMITEISLNGAWDGASFGDLQGIRMDQMGKNRTEPGRAFGPSGLIHRSGLELFDLNFLGVKMNAEHALELQVRHCKYVKDLSKIQQHALASWKGWSPER